MKIKTLILVMLAVFVAMPAFARAESRADDNNNDDSAIENRVDDDNNDDDSAVEDDEDGDKNDSNGDNDDDSLRERGTSSEAVKAQREKIREEIKNKIEQRKELRSEMADEHRSAVASFVQSLLDVADRQALDGIGEHVREVAKQQNDAEDKIGPMLDEIKNRSKVKKFFFGADLGVTKEVKKEIMDTQKRLDDLEKAKVLFEGEDKAQLEAQIKNLKENITAVLADVQAEEEKPSMFGWLKRFFAR